MHLFRIIRVFLYTVMQVDLRENFGCQMILMKPLIVSRSICDVYHRYSCSVVVFPETFDARADFEEPSKKG